MPEITSRSTTTLTISSFGDDNVYDFLKNSSLMTSFIRQCGNNVTLRFQKNYVSPAFAVPVMAIRDELREEERWVYFNKKDIEHNAEVLTFFEHSGMHDSFDTKSKKLVEEEIGKEDIIPSSIWASKAHMISLEKIRAGVLSEDTMVNDSVELLVPLYVALEMTECYPDLISGIMELYANAYIHGKGKSIYSIAQKALDGDILVAIYDNGIGIPQSYRDYQQRRPEGQRTELSDSEIMNWAFLEGTSTKQAQKGIPCGVGLPSIRRFSDRYGGEFGIASGTGIYYYKDGKVKSEEMSNGMNGTMFMLKIPCQEKEPRK